MNLSPQIANLLQSSVGQTNLVWRLVDRRRTLHCQAERCDPLAVEVIRFELETDELANADPERLKTASGQLCRRITYLLEPIAPIEIDPHGCSVQMRSAPPQRDDDGRRYYELLLQQGGAISLQRYEKMPQQGRQPIPATLTHETVVRLIADFETTLDEY